MSKSSTKAQDLLTRIKRYLTEDHLYEHTEGNLISEFNGWKPPHGELEWSQNQIFVRHRKSGERDPSVQALGIAKQIYGSRLDLLILDDSLVMDNQISETTRQRIDEWFTNEARSRAHKGQTVVNGTRLLPYDLYGQWKKSWQDHPLYRLVLIPAVLDEFSDNERPSWPEYWEMDGKEEVENHNDEDVVVGYVPGLRDIRQEISARDPNRWKLVYQQEDVEETQSVFRQEHIARALELGASRSVGQVFPHEILILGVDPATSGRAAALLMAVDPETRVRTPVELFVGSQLGAVGLRRKLFYYFWDKYQEHPVNITIPEINYAPTLLGDETFLSRADAAGTKVVKHKTLGRGSKRGSKWDEEYGVGAMAALFTGGLIALPSKTAADAAHWQPLIDDMLVFPWAEKQDVLIALWIANGEASASRFEPVDQQRIFRRRNVPPVVLRR